MLTGHLFMRSRHILLRTLFIGFFSIITSLSCISMDSDEFYPQLFCFETARTVVRPLQLSQLARVQELDKSDPSFITIMNDHLAEILKAQEQELRDLLSFEDLKRKLQPESSSFCTRYLYYGVSNKE